MPLPIFLVVYVALWLQEKAGTSVLMGPFDDPGSGFLHFKISVSRHVKLVSKWQDNCSGL